MATQSGIVWVSQSAATPGNTLNGVTYDPENDLWVFVGPGGGGTGEILTVPGQEMFEGTPTFTARTSAGSTAINGIAYGPIGGSLAPLRAVGDGAEIQRSIDGIIWSLDTTAALSADFFAVHFGPGPATLNLGEGFFVAVGNSEIATQTPLFGLPTDTWQLVATEAGVWQSVVDMPDVRWVTVAGNAAITKVSVDGGITWAPFVTDLSQRGRTIGFGNRRFLCAVNGDVESNPTGENSNWSAVTTPPSTSVNALRHIEGSKWVACGVDGDVSYSLDNGDIWVTQDLGVSTDDFFAIGYDHTRDLVVICGENGRVFTSTSVVVVESPSLQPNDDHEGQALGRLAEQFKS